MHVISPMVHLTPVQCRANDYVHTSGVAFARISHREDDNDRFDSDVSRSGEQKLCMGFHWMPNFMLTKRWRSAATGDKGASSKLRSEFEDFCADKNGALKAFWDSCKESAKKAGGSTTDVDETVVLRDKEPDRAQQMKNGVSDSLEINSSGSSHLVAD